MDIAFLDTNALLKLYLPERGASWLKGFTNSRQIIVAELALIEAATVLRRLQLEGVFTRIQTYDIYAKIKQDSLSFEIVSVGGETFRDRLSNLIFNLAAGLRIRALDAIHLTAADVALTSLSHLTPTPVFTFVTSDRQLVAAAQFQGWTVENPENYP